MRTPVSSGSFGGTNAAISSRFIGVWRLLSCEARSSKGDVRYPLGERPSGQLVYDGVGHMSAQLMKADRPRFLAVDPARGTDAEVRQAFDGYIAYFGLYSIDEGARTVSHLVHGASYPNWVGATLTRTYAFDAEGRLRLSTPPVMVGGESLEYVLVWERMSHGGSDPLSRHPSRGLTPD